MFSSSRRRCMRRSARAALAAPALLRAARSHGFRTDVLAAVRQLGVPIERSPGGSFASEYAWDDGIGPPKARPRTLDRAWNTLESNRFGTDEFLAGCKAAGTAPYLTVNLGTGTIMQAAALVEYGILPAGTRWSGVPRPNGHRAPYGVRFWGLDSELFGPWVIGHMSGQRCGRKAADTAQAMRRVERSIYLSACGSSDPARESDLAWDREALKPGSHEVDAVSVHCCLGDTRAETGGSPEQCVALNRVHERLIRDKLAVCESVRARPSERKRLALGLDEWKVWDYDKTRSNGERQLAPHRLEEADTLADALVVGSMLNTMMRHADRIQIGCLAQLVNSLAPITTDAHGRYLQTIYDPDRGALECARGASLELLVDAPTYPVAGLGPVPYLDAAATFDAATGRRTPCARKIVWESAAPARVGSAFVLTGGDLNATNSFGAP
jgi:alpha-N-arabinofuranosidase